MIGKTLGNYEIVSRLGEGGMGIVYVAEHRLIGRKAAVKVLRPELLQDADVVTRFFNEARATTRIKHPGLVDIFDFGHFPDGSAYIAMELLEGDSLAAAIKNEGPLSLQRIVAIGRQVAAALGAAHDKGITHRDLKPDNIFLVPDADFPGGTRVKILDFGIAKLTDAAERSHGLTRTGTVMGTPYYMSPEQCKSAAMVDHRSDIYALGCVLFEMACGRPPFDKDSIGEMIAAHLAEDPPSVRSIIPSASLALDTVIQKALAKRPEDRQSSILQLKDELDSLISDVALARTAAHTGEGIAPAVAVERPVINPVKLLKTTLGGSIGEIREQDGANGAPRSRRGIAVGVGLGIVAALAVGVLVVRSARTPRESASSSVTLPETTLKPDSAKPLPVVIRLDLDPADAHVTLDGKPVAGAVIELMRGAPSPGMRIERQGYVAVSMQLPTDRDQTIKFHLNKDGVVSAPLRPAVTIPDEKAHTHHVTKPTKPAPRKKAAALSDGVIDDY